MPLGLTPSLTRSYAVDFCALKWPNISSNILFLIVGVTNVGPFASTNPLQALPEQNQRTWETT